MNQVKRMQGRYGGGVNSSEVLDGPPRGMRKPIEPESSTDNDGYNISNPDDDEPAPVEDEVKADDAVLDLAELEQLQEEAERMKGLGNKHMAAQVSLDYAVYSWLLYLFHMINTMFIFFFAHIVCTLFLIRNIQEHIMPTQQPCNYLLLVHHRMSFYPTVQPLCYH